MANEALLQQKVKDLTDTLNFREPDKVPVGMGLCYWQFGYAGVKYEDIVDDPEATAAAHRKHLEDIEYDWSFLSNVIAIRVYESLGSKEYTFGSDRTTIQHNQTALNLMPPEEYDDLIKDYPKYMATKFLKRRFPVLFGDRKTAYEALKKLAVAQRTYMRINALMNKEYLEKGVRPISTNDPTYAPRWYSPLATIFTRLRGMSNSLIDLRKRPDQLRAAAESILKHQVPVKPSTANPDAYLTRDPWPLSNTIYHCECFLSPPQFDEFFFKNFKTAALPFMEKGARYFLKGEGNFLNTIDRYKELPKGSMAILLDMDDPFEAYKHIGNYHTLIAGPACDLLKSGTKQQCIDYTKKCFDTFAPGGGYIFAPPTPFVSPVDANIENVLAVYQFANEYGKKK